MLDIHLRVPEPLAEAARTRSGLPPTAPIAALVRLALAKLAGWPPEAVEAVTRQRGKAAPDG